jgi:hypothetical protein
MLCGDVMVDDQWQWEWFWVVNLCKGHKSSSHHHIITSSHQHIITSSHHHILPIHNIYTYKIYARVFYFQPLEIWEKHARVFYFPPLEIWGKHARVFYFPPLEIWGQGVLFSAPGNHCLHAAPGRRGTNCLCWAP